MHRMSTPTVIEKHTELEAVTSDPFIDDLPRPARETTGRIVEQPTRRRIYD